MRTVFLALLASALLADELPIVGNVELQPLAAQVERVAEALQMTGEPLPAAERTDLAPAKTVQRSRTFSTAIAWSASTSIRRAASKCRKDRPSRS